MVTSVTNFANGQFGVAVAAGVFVNIGDGINVIVAATAGVFVDVNPVLGVALNNASTVCAAAVKLAVSLVLLLALGKLQALKVNIRIISKLKRRVLFFIVSPSFFHILPQDDFDSIP
jgi:hypothetical protein